MEKGTQLAKNAWGQWWPTEEYFLKQAAVIVITKH